MYLSPWAKMFHVACVVDCGKILLVRYDGEGPFGLPGGNYFPESGAIDGCLEFKISRLTGYSIATRGLLGIYSLACKSFVAFDAEITGYSQHFSEEKFGHELRFFALDDPHTFPEMDAVSAEILKAKMASPSAPVFRALDSAKMMDASQLWEDRSIGGPLRKLFAL